MCPKKLDLLLLQRDVCLERRNHDSKSPLCTGKKIFPKNSNWQMKAQCLLLSLDVIRLHPTKSFQSFYPVGFGHFCGIGTVQAGAGGGRPATGGTHRRQQRLRQQLQHTHTHSRGKEKRGERQKKIIIQMGKKSWAQKMDLVLIRGKTLFSWIFPPLKNAHKVGAKDTSFRSLLNEATQVLFSLSVFPRSSFTISLHMPPPCSTANLTRKANDACATHLGNAPHVHAKK